jgi:hypothetical protein
MQTSEANSINNSFNYRESLDREIKNFDNKNPPQQELIIVVSVFPLVPAIELLAKKLTRLAVEFI